MYICGHLWISKIRYMRGLKYYSEGINLTFDKRTRKAMSLNSKNQQTTNRQNVQLLVFGGVGNPQGADSICGYTSTGLSPWLF